MWENVAQSFALAAFKKAGKDKGEGKPTFSTRSFPLSLFIYPKLMESFGLLLKIPETHGEFRAAPKNAVHFLYGAALHRPGESPWTPYAVLSLFDAGVLIRNSAQAEFGALAHGF